MAGTVIPHWLGYSLKGAIEDPGNQTNNSMRVGEVKEIVYPKDTKSLSKKYIEYTVDVSHRDGSGPEVTTTYTGCTIGNVFGTGGDSLRYTLRTDSKTGANKDKTVGVGSKVILHCINGSKTRAIITGGIRDEETSDVVDSKDLGHNLKFNFNGLSVSIADNGDFVVAHNGATDNHGKSRSSVNKDNVGQALSFTLEGDVTLVGAVGDGSVEQQHIKLDHAQRQIDVVAADTYSSVAPGGHTLYSKNGNIVLHAKRNLIGSENAAEAEVLGTTYRSKEEDLHRTLKKELTAASQAFSSLGTYIQQAAMQLQIASTANAIPYTGGAMAKANFAAAALALNTTGPLWTQLQQKFSNMSDALDEFENQKGDFLSQKNFGEK